jgi:hypothetical protein
MGTYLPARAHLRPESVRRLHAERVQKTEPFDSISDWWLDADSNRRPRDYETLALTT